MIFVNLEMAVAINKFFASAAAIFHIFLQQKEDGAHRPLTLIKSF